MSEDSYKAVYGGLFVHDPYKDYKDLFTFVFSCQEYSLSTGEKVASVHPPQATVQIQKDVLAGPYKTCSKNLSEPVNINAVNQVVEQNNYTNLLCGACRRAPRGFLRGKAVSDQAEAVYFWD
ncbi:hypothetical protein TIFTF001_018340 [Ficus carica]|uniref:Uncharacterized protein n=1 Tax=Ficus carica TaxID=3494 RepID=A0AA88DJ73_FICCA|nr:hypothetical protein TIFTF001_018340 [Ficus carica]